MRYHGKAFRKKVKVLWHGIVNSGSGAHPTVRAQDRKGRMTDPDCLRTRIRSSDDLAVLPPQSSTQMPFRGSGTRDVQPPTVPQFRKFLIVPPSKFEISIHVNDVTVRPLHLQRIIKVHVFVI